MSIGSGGDRRGHGDKRWRDDRRRGGHLQRIVLGGWAGKFPTGPSKIKLGRDYESGGQEFESLRAEKGAKDERPGIELFRSRVLRQPLVIRNGTRANCDRTIAEIGPFRQEG